MTLAEAPRPKEGPDKEIGHVTSFWMDELLKVSSVEFRRIAYESTLYTDHIRRTLTIHGKVAGKDDVLFLASEFDIKTNEFKSGYISRDSNKDQPEDPMRQTNDIVEIGKWVGQLSRRR